VQLLAWARARAPPLFIPPASAAPSVRHPQVLYDASFARFGDARAAVALLALILPAQVCTLAAARRRQSARVGWRHRQGRHQLGVAPLSELLQPALNCSQLLLNVLKCSQVILLAP
jgi:hypothetical protein